MMVTVSRHEVIETLRKAGFKATPQRLATYEALAANDVHPTVEQLYEIVRRDYPAISLNTIYAALQTLLAVGLVRQLRDRQGTMARFDAHMGPHAHVVCDSCGNIENLEGAMLNALVDIQRAAIAATGFQIANSDLYLHGNCPRCQPAPAEL